MPSVVGETHRRRKNAGGLMKWEKPLNALNVQEMRRNARC